MMIILQFQQWEESQKLETQQAGSNTTLA